MFIGLIVRVLISEDRMVNVIIFLQIKQMIVNVIGSEELFKYFFRISCELVFSDKFSILNEALFKDLITIVVVD